MAHICVLLARRHSRVLPGCQEQAQSLGSLSEGRRVENAARLGMPARVAKQQMPEQRLEGGHVNHNTERGM